MGRRGEQLPHPADHDRGVFISKLGSQGLDIDQFNQPQGIAIDPSGTVLVADTLNNRVQAFVDQNGPDVTFDPGGPGTMSPSTSATFNFHANEPGSTYECKLDAAPVIRLVRVGRIGERLGGGPAHLLRAGDGPTDNVGNPSTYDWSVDTTPPGVVIDSAPIRHGRQRDREHLVPLHRAQLDVQVLARRRRTSVLRLVLLTGRSRERRPHVRCLVDRPGRQPEHDAGVGVVDRRRDPAGRPHPERAERLHEARSTRRSLSTLRSDRHLRVPP